MNIFKLESQINKDNYFVVEYYLGSSVNLREASWQLAIGQSVGNPNVRNRWETDELFEKYSCLILDTEKRLSEKKEGKVKIAFPVVNIDFKTDGIAHLLVNIMGGQMDIESIDVCQVLNIDFPKSVHDLFLGPKFGIEGIRKFTGIENKPLLGAIVKPKTGISASVLLQMVKQLVEGGVNFIKEDEIMSNPSFWTIEERVPLIKY